MIFSQILYTFRWGIFTLTCVIEITSTNFGHISTYIYMFLLKELSKLKLHFCLTPCSRVWRFFIFEYRLHNPRSEDYKTVSLYGFWYGVRSILIADKSYRADISHRADFRHTFLKKLFYCIKNVKFADFQTFFLNAVLFCFF